MKKIAIFLILLLLGSLACKKGGPNNNQNRPMPVKETRLDVQYRSLKLI